MVFKDTYEDLSPERLEEIIDLFEAGKGSEVPVGTQIDRVSCAPVGGLTALTSDPNVKASKAKKRKASKPANISAKKPVSKAATLVSSTKPAVKKKAASAKTVPAKKAATKKPAVTQAASLDDKNRPKGMDRPAEIDDLKLVSGIGPKIEGILHGLGIYKFAQVGKWKKAERDWVDGYLRFKGRIERDDWIKQAKALAKGGRDEYVKQFGKEPR